jgi:hypothetical protein
MDIIENLEDVLAFLDDYIDIDADGGPNAAMRAAAKIEAVIEALARRAA